MSEVKARKPRVVRTDVPLLDSKVAVYAGTRVAKALHEVTFDMDLYKGVRLNVLLEAVYVQGKKDGAREVAESFEKMMNAIPHRNPGKPKKRSR